MVAKNQLLGSGKVIEEKADTRKVCEPIKFYSKDYPEGKVHEGIEGTDMIAMMKRKGWSETPLKVAETTGNELKDVIPKTTSAKTKIKK